MVEIKKIKELYRLLHQKTDEGVEARIWFFVGCFLIVVSTFISFNEYYKAKDWEVHKQLYSCKIAAYDRNRVAWQCNNGILYWR